jgi:Zn-dependent peptidase ImmA (M78 family)
VKTYRKLVKFLTAEFPAELPIKARRLKISCKLNGDCLLRDDHYRIRINRELPEHEAVDVLIHEWAHVLAWHKCGEDFHCDEWGKSYSRIYRKFSKEFLDKKPEKKAK